MNDEDKIRYAYNILKNCEKYLSGKIDIKQIKTNGYYGMDIHMNDRNLNKLYFIHELGNYELNMMNQMLSQPQNKDDDLIRVSLMLLEISNFDTEILASNFFHKIMNYIFEARLHKPIMHISELINSAYIDGHLSAYDIVMSDIYSHGVYNLSHPLSKYRDYIVCVDHDNKYWEKALKDIEKYSKIVFEKSNYML